MIREARNLRPGDRVITDPRDPRSPIATIRSNIADHDGQRRIIVVQKDGHPTESTIIAHATAPFRLAAATAELIDALSGSAPL